MAINIYRNGNTIVTIDDKTGTKKRKTEDDEFIPEFPESIDISIGRRCDGDCHFCYEGATPDGPEGDLLDIPFIDTLSPFIEVAINGNSVNHPQLIPFLKKLKSKKVFANMTVNQIHFEQKEDIIADLIKNELIYGLGVSLRNPNMSFIRKAQKYPNLVIHTIAGIHSPKDYVHLINKGLKILILGYKDKGRGHDYLKVRAENIGYNMRWLKENIFYIINTGWYPLISFDNLALEQLDIKSVLSQDQWDHFYQGDDGQHSMYIDLVDRTFGKSSLVPKEEMIPLKDDIKEMFQIVRSL